MAALCNRALSFERADAMRCELESGIKARTRAKFAGACLASEGASKAFKVFPPFIGCG